MAQSLAIGAMGAENLHHARQFAYARWLMFLKDNEISEAVELILALTVANSICLLLGYLKALDII